jgi:hypothetical protein
MSRHGKPRVPEKVHEEPESGKRPMSEVPVAQHDETVRARLSRSAHLSGVIFRETEL